MDNQTPSNPPPSNNDTGEILKEAAKDAVKDVIEELIINEIQEKTGIVIPGLSSTSSNSGKSENPKGTGKNKSDSEEVIFLIEKKEGKINEIIYEHTTYHSGKYRLYPTITDLNSLLKEIIEAKATTEYIRINPFYINERLNSQIEFEEYMFYIECREEEISENDIIHHVKECLSANYETITTEEFEMGKILYPLCKHNHVEQFHLALEKYRKYLNDELLIKMFKIAKKDLQLNDDDLAFGYFCFEVHSE